MDRLGKYLVVFVLLLSGCPADTNTDLRDFSAIPDLSVNPNADLSGLDWSGGGQVDLSGPLPDGTAGYITVHYSLINNNNEEATWRNETVLCGQGADGGTIGTVDPAVTQVIISATNGTDTRTKMVSCTLGSYDGYVTIPLPTLPPGGQWTIAGSAVDHPSSACDVVCTSDLFDTVTVFIYADGCDQGNFCSTICSTCPCN